MKPLQIVGFALNLLALTPSTALAAKDLPPVSCLDAAQRPLCPRGAAACYFRFQGSGTCVAAVCRNINPDNAVPVHLYFPSASPEWCEKVEKSTGSILHWLQPQ